MKDVIDNLFHIAILSIERKIVTLNSTMCTKSQKIYYQSRIAKIIVQ